MMIKKGASFVYTLMAVFLLIYFSPYLTLFSMKRAAEEKNSDKLSQYVDYPALRESFKANVGAYLANQMTQNKNGFEALGMALGVAMVNQMVDAFITPENVAMLIKGQSNQLNGSPSPAVQGTSSKTDTDISMSYGGLNQFAVKIKTKSSSNDPVELIFNRHDIVFWKLVGLRMPFPSFNHQTVSQNIDSTQNSQKVEPEKDNSVWLPATLANKYYQEADVQKGTYQNAINFDITLDTSKLKKPTRAVKGVLILSDLFKEPKFRLNWTINQPLTPGTSYTETGVGFNYNQFEDSHNWVRSTDLKDMTFKFVISKILYQDGTQENL